MLWCHTAGGVLQCYRDLTLVNRDGMNVILVKINQILMEKFLKLQDVPRTQVNPHCYSIYVIVCHPNIPLRKTCSKSRGCQ